MKKKLLCIMALLLLCLFITPVYMTEAAIYKTGRYSDSSTYAMALDMFSMNGNRCFVGIYKDCISIPEKSDYYEYVITFDQPNNSHYINVSKILIVSESANIMINSGFKPNRNIGLESISDTLRTNDTGKFNMVLLTAQSKMLIRVIDINNYSYDFYASKDFIENCKKVANWS